MYNVSCGVNYRPRRLRGVCETREPVDLGVPGTMILDIVEGVDALDATSASAACFADLEGKLRPERSVSKRARTVHAVESFRTLIPPCVRTLDPPFCAGPFRRNSSP